MTKASTVEASPPVKKGGGRPRKNLIILRFDNKDENFVLPHSAQRKDPSYRKAEGVVI